MCIVNYIDVNADGQQGDRGLVGSPNNGHMWKSTNKIRFFFLNFKTSDMDMSIRAPQTHIHVTSGQQGRAAHAQPKNPNLYATSIPVWKCRLGWAAGTGRLPPLAYLRAMFDLMLRSRCKCRGAVYRGILALDQSPNGKWRICNSVLGRCCTRSAQQQHALPWYAQLWLSM